MEGMRKQPFFSIIIPVYDVEKYLSDCLDSVFSQSFCDYEVICIEDSSPDNSKNILNQYQKVHREIMSIVEHPVNRGLSAARNSGLAVARGKYVLFLDADDMLSKGALETIFGVVSSDYLDIVRFGMMRVGDEIFDSEINTIPVEVTDGISFLYKKVCDSDFRSQVWKNAFSSEFISQYDLRFYDGIYHEDILFSVQAFTLASRVKEISDICYQYRYNTCSISTNPTEKNYHSLFVIIMELYSLWRRQSHSENIDEIFSLYLKYCYRYMEKMRQMVPDLEASNGLTVGTKAEETLWRIFQKDSTLEYELTPFSDNCLRKIKKASRVWLYGPGAIGIIAKEYLLSEDVEIRGFIISRGRKNTDDVAGIPVYEYGEIDIAPNDVIVITVTEKYLHEIESMLDKDGIKNWISVQVV